MRNFQVRFYTSLFTIFSLLLLLLPAGFVMHSLSTEAGTEQQDTATQSPNYVKLSESIIAFEQRGIASWYGPRFHGRLTANGEHYNMYAMTAAHKQLPFGSIVKVINRENGKATLVRINDRGPYVARRIIDLTYTAATRYLGFVGIAPVQLQGFQPLQPKYILQQKPAPGAVLLTLNTDLDPIIPLRSVTPIYTSRNFTKTLFEWDKQRQRSKEVYLQILMPQDSASYQRTLRWGKKRRSTPVFVYRLVTPQPLQIVSTESTATEPKHYE